MNRQAWLKMATEVLDKAGIADAAADALRIWRSTNAGIHAATDALWTANAGIWYATGSEC